MRINDKVSAQNPGKICKNKQLGYQEKINFVLKSLIPKVGTNQLTILKSLSNSA